MEKTYSIEEILSAVNDLQIKKSERKKENSEFKKNKTDYSIVPKNTLKLIEEAEKIKN
jgi:hypothetical protein